MTFKGALNEALENGAIEGLSKGNSRSASFEIKADMTTGADFTGEVIPADRVPGIQILIQHVQRIFVNYWRKVQHKADVVRFVKESQDIQTVLLQLLKVLH